MMVKNLKFKLIFENCIRCLTNAQIIYKIITKDGVCLVNLLKKRVQVLS